MSTTPTPDETRPAAPPVPPPLPAILDVAGREVPPASLRKSPGAAAALSLFPGLGHLYLGLYERGFMLAIAVFTAFYLDLPPVGIFAFFFTMIDAYRQAQIINLGGYDPTPKATGRPTGSLGLGVFLVVIGAVLLLRHWIDIEDYLDWLRDWWPVILVIVGGYLIWGSFREREAARRADLDASDTLD